MRIIVKAQAAAIAAGLVLTLPAFAQDVVKIGAIYPVKTLTGEQGRRSSELAAQLINDRGGVLGGKKIELTIYDDAFRPAEGVAAARRLMSENGIKIITGGIASAVAIAVLQIVKENNGLFLSAVTKHPDITAYSRGFRLNTLAVTDMKDLSTVLNRAANPQRLSVLADNSDFGRTMINTLKGIYGDRMVQSEIYEIMNQTDFSTIATKTKANNPDVVCLGFVAMEQGAALMRALREAGVNAKICITPGALIPQLITAAGPASDGAISEDTWTPDLENPENKKFGSVFRAKFKEEPGKVDFLAFISINMLAGAIEKAGTATDMDKLAIALRDGTWQTPGGDYRFQDGQAVGMNPIQIVVKDGRITTVQ